MPINPKTSQIALKIAADILKTILSTTEILSVGKDRPNTKLKPKTKLEGCTIKLF